jgi:hypothetical protein
MDKLVTLEMACKETGIEQNAIEKATDYIDTRLGNRFEWGKTFVLSGKSCPMISVELRPITPIKIDKILKHTFTEFKLTMEIANCKKEKEQDTKDYYWIELSLRWEHGGGGSNGHDLDFVLIYDVESKQLTEKEHGI